MTQPDLGFVEALWTDPNTWPEIDSAHPTVYAAHAAELGAEAQRHDSARAQVLARLEQGEATNIELNRICYRYGARILELRRAGYPITAEPAGRGVWTYRLERGGAA